MSSPIKHNATDLSCNGHNNINMPVFSHQVQAADHSDRGSTPSSGEAISSYSFPVKLHYMLTEVEKDGLAHIVSWQPHGRAFMVHNREAFVASFLPNWFLQSKFTSFQRQLNVYGFRRITSGRDKGAYYHKLFLRGKPLLSCRIARTTVKGKGPRKPASPATEPDFYSMPPLPPSNSASTSASVSVAHCFLGGVGKNRPRNVRQSAENPALIDWNSSLYLRQHDQGQKNSEHYSGRALSFSSFLNPTNNNCNYWSHYYGM